MKKNEEIILIVEDEKPLLEAIKQKLEFNGISSVTARSVDQALSYLEEIDGVSGIWVDHYLLGKENGLDLLAKVKDKNSKWKNIPIFVVSNTASPDKIKSYIALGASEYYTKSDHKLSEIIEDIKRHLAS